MRSFGHIARLIKDKRVAHPSHYSQTELSNLLGYKNGQFISNVERGLCSIPLKMLAKVSVILDLPQAELKDALLKDFEYTIDAHIKKHQDRQDLNQ